MKKILKWFRNSTPIEKGIMSVILFIMIVWLSISCAMYVSIERAGGVDQIIIDAGKDYKRIIEEIKKD